MALVFALCPPAPAASGPAALTTVNPAANAHPAAAAHSSQVASLPPGAARALSQLDLSASPFRDEIRKALSMHLLDDSESFDESAPITTAELARALDRARACLPPHPGIQLPDLPVNSKDSHPLTRAEVIALVTAGLVPDVRCGSKADGSGPAPPDPDVEVAYAVGIGDYLSGITDSSDIAPSNMGAIAVALYKGWLPNANYEWGKLRPNAIATHGYAACLLARAVPRAGDYTGIIIDMSGLQPIDRAGGMWVLGLSSSGDVTPSGPRIYPDGDHQALRPYFSAPGVLGYYGDINSALKGRGGSNPLVIRALDWAQYDWSTLHGEPGLRHGSSTPVSLASFPFVRGTPPLILVSAEDAEKLRQADRDSLLLRTFRVALVQPNWAME